MDRIDRLILKVQSSIEPGECLAVDNPYLSKTCDELLDMMCPETIGGYCAPPMGTPEWEKFMYAINHGESVNALTE